MGTMHNKAARPLIYTTCSSIDANSETNAMGKSKKQTAFQSSKLQKCIMSGIISLKTIGIEQNQGKTLKQ